MSDDVQRTGLRIVLVDTPRNASGVLIRLIFERGRPADTVLLLDDLAAALDLLRDDPPDIVLIVWSSVRDSTARWGNVREVEAARKIRAAPGGATVPLILITARGDQQTVAEAQEAGANLLIPAPIVHHDLIGIVDDVIAGRPVDLTRRRG
jgi:CheY-like chemotaxis protein